MIRLSISHSDRLPAQESEKLANWIIGPICHNIAACINPRCPQQAAHMVSVNVSAHAGDESLPQLVFTMQIFDEELRHRFHDYALQRLKHCFIAIVGDKWPLAPHQVEIREA